MCRLFAYVSPGTSTTERELGDAGIETFLSLARLHGDGWGWSGIPRPGDAPALHKSPLSAAADPGFRATIATPGHAAMLHLRWATLGLPVELRNAHPFRVGDTSFEHNGSLKPIERVRAMLSPDAAARMTGDTDSEMYFTLILEEQAAGSSLPEATVRVARRLREAFPLASLNAILLDREQMVVVHASARSILPDDDIAEITQLGGLPDDHNEDYFALRWKHTPDGTVQVSSTGVGGDGWETLPAESVTTVRLDDRATETVSLAVPAGASVTD
ncbi:class II glutamine amidotransferase [Microbacterium mangrovi]|uniref:class II glutamine amidotransferase n=1 Tax=Microbacterium mangrovi TaxID=1348253 RepID=UPI0006896B2C|nr:class II glutamine amidotransferase [Microbacterium mangrovi]